MPVDSSGFAAGMENATYIATALQLALRREMSVIANNVANINTPAFKAERMIFREFIERPTPQEKLSFVQDVGLARDLSEGPLRQTGNPLDLAVVGDGYFSVLTPDGVRYTRHGRFHLDDTGQVVTSAGRPLLDEGGAPVTIPPGTGEPSIAADGAISGRNGAIGKLGLVRFADEPALKRLPEGLLDAGDQPAEALPDGRMVQGALELSNVQGIVEITRMIDVHRAYQNTQRFLQDEHEKRLRAVNQLGRTRQS